ncbi:hypothetical protein L208DRAFT_1277151, partial [Tricholoma matsutake]
PHTVLTVDSAICYGGHFYASSMLEESNFGFFNSFLGSTLLTNAQHTSDAQLMLQQMVAYFHHVYLQPNYNSPVSHVPVVTDPDGLMVLLSMCNLLEASNILHHGTCITGGLQAAERMEMIQG